MVGTPLGRLPYILQDRQSTTNSPTAQTVQKLQKPGEIRKQTGNEPAETPAGPKKEEDSPPTKNRPPPGAHPGSSDNPSSGKIILTRKRPSQSTRDRGHSVRVPERPLHKTGTPRTFRKDQLSSRNLLIPKTGKAVQAPSTGFPLLLPDIITGNFQNYPTITIYSY